MANDIAPKYGNCCCGAMDQCPFENDCSLVTGSKPTNYGNAIKICASSTSDPPLVVPFPDPFVGASEATRLPCYCTSCSCSCPTGNKAEDETKINLPIDKSKSSESEPAHQQKKKEDKKLTSQKKSTEKRDSDFKIKDEVYNKEEQTAAVNATLRMSVKRSLNSLKIDKKEKDTLGAKGKDTDDYILQYLEGMYPGIHVGHRNCTDPQLLVPSTMGWLWNLEDSCSGLEPRRGWRPGAIDKVIMRLIRRAKRAAGMSVDSFPVSPGGRKKQRTRPVSKRSSKTNQSKDSDKIRPTLLLHKTKGRYHVAMNTRILDQEDEVDLQKPLEINVVNKRNEGSLYSSSTDSSLEVQLICPGSVLNKPSEPEIIDEKSKTELTKSKPTTVAEKRKPKKIK